MIPTLLHLTQYTIITLTGEKAATFLQGQLTCDLREINENQSRLGAHCNHKGRVLALMRVIQYENHLHLLLPNNMADFLIQELQKYASLSRVNLIKNTTLSILGCYGDNFDLPCSIISHLPIQVDDAVISENVSVVRIHDAANYPRYLIIGPIDPIIQLTLYQPDHLDHPTQWDKLDIEAGIAQIHPETRGLFTPHMLNYTQFNAVSFKKGCYIGQEVIARTHYLGKNKRHLQKLIIDSTDFPVPGERLTNAQGQEIGTVVTAAPTLNGQFHSLVMA